MHVKLSGVGSTPSTPYLKAKVWPMGTDTEYGLTVVMAVPSPLILISSPPLPYVPEL